MIDEYLDALVKVIEGLVLLWIAFFVVVGILYGVVWVIGAVAGVIL